MRNKFTMSLSVLFFSLGVLLYPFQESRAQNNFFDKNMEQHLPIGERSFLTKYKSNSNNQARLENTNSRLIGYVEKSYNINNFDYDIEDSMGFFWGNNYRNNSKEVIELYLKNLGFPYYFSNEIIENLSDIQLLNIYFPYQESDLYNISSDSIKRYFWDEFDMEYKDYIKLLKTYNSQNNLTNNSFYIVDGNDTYQEDFRMEITYNSNGLITENKTTKKELGVWENYVKINYEYDTHDNITVMKLDKWDMVSSDWISNIKYIVDYNNNDKMSEIIVMWSSGIALENLLRVVFDYDQNGNVIEEQQLEWQENNSVWEKDYKIAYSYDNGNNMIEKMSQHWDGFSWINEDKEEYSYDGNGNLIKVIISDWDNDIWNKVSKLILEYENGNRAGHIYSIWDQANSEYWEAFKIEYTYNSFGQLKNLIGLENLGADFEPSNGAPLVEFEYEEYEGPIAVTELENNFEIYPNPTKNEIIIESESILFDEIRIVDITGKTLFHNVDPILSKKNIINIEHLKTGLYYIILKKGDKVQTKSIEKL